MRDAARPARARAGREGAGRPATRQAAIDMVTAPANEASRPRGVTAPDVPGGTGRKVVMCTGQKVLRDPISVAQVSAVAAARQPVNPTSQ